MEGPTATAACAESCLRLLSRKLQYEKRLSLQQTLISRYNRLLAVAGRPQPELEEMEGLLLLLRAEF